MMCAACCSETGPSYIGDEQSKKQGGGSEHMCVARVWVVAQRVACCSETGPFCTGGERRKWQGRG